MSWEIRLTPWSIVISVFHPMWNLLHSELSWFPPFFFRSCSHTVLGYMRISPRMLKVCILFQSYRMGGVRYKICLLFVFQIHLWGDPCKTLFGSSQWGNCQIFLKFYLKNMLWESTIRLPSNSKKSSARAEDLKVTVSIRRWHRRNVRTNYFWKHKCIMKSLKHFKADNFDFFQVPALPQLPYRSDSAGWGWIQGRNGCWAAVPLHWKKSPSEDKKGTLQRRKKNPLKTSPDGFTASPPEIHFKPP